MKYLPPTYVTIHGSSYKAVRYCIVIKLKFYKNASTCRYYINAIVSRLLSPHVYIVLLFRRRQNTVAVVHVCAR